MHRDKFEKSNRRESSGIPTNALRFLVVYFLYNHIYTHSHYYAIVARSFQWTISVDTSISRIFISLTRAASINLLYDSIVNAWICSTFSVLFSIKQLVPFFG